jgi:hypothetical protein
MLVIQWLSVLLPLCILLFLFHAVSEYRKTTKIIYDDLKKLAKISAHLYTLVDILSESTHPYVKMLFSEFRRLPLDQLPKNKKEEFALLKDIALKRFSAGRTILMKMIMEEDDPVQRQKMNDNLNEIENMMTLLSSIDKGTSEEYMNSVMVDMLSTIYKMTNMEQE